MRSRAAVAIAFVFVSSAVLTLVLLSCDRADVPRVDEARSPRGTAGRLISTPDMEGWRHSGAGSFDVTIENGMAVYTSHGGLGLLWYEASLADFEVTLDLRVAEARTNSGVFLRVPDPTDPAYVSRSFEVQIDTGGVGTAATGAIFDVQPPIVARPLQAGRWHRLRIRAAGPRIVVWIDDVLVNDFRVRTGGKVLSYAPEGYLGLQNHSGADVVRFRNIRLHAA